MRVVPRRAVAAPAPRQRRPRTGRAAGDVRRPAPRRSTAGLAVAGLLGAAVGALTTALVTRRPPAPAPTPDPAPALQLAGVQVAAPLPVLLPAPGEAAAEPATSGAVLRHDELPLPDYDHLTLASLRSRLRTLPADGLEQVLAYEKAHASRPQIVRMFENRLVKLAALEAARQQAAAAQSDAASDLA